MHGRLNVAKAPVPAQARQQHRLGDHPSSQPEQDVVAAMVRATVTDELSGRLRVRLGVATA
jgi:hypothetical protein